MAETGEGSRENVPLAPEASGTASFALRVVVAAVTAYLIGTVLASLSGTSLLFPEAWRETVRFVATIAGIMSFGLGDWLGQRWGAFEKHRPSTGRGGGAANPVGPGPDTRTGLGTRLWPAVSNWGSTVLARLAERKEPSGRVRVVSWCMLAVVIGLLVVFAWVRARCVYRFDPAPWLATQLAAERSSIDNTMAGPASRPAPESGQDRPAATPDKAVGKDDRSPEDRLAPEFVNARDKLISIPFRLPKQDQDYVDYVTRHRHFDGVRVLLDEQPGLVINWLSGDAHMDLLWTTYAFLSIYLAFIMSTLFLLGLQFDAIEVVCGAAFGI